MLDHSALEPDQEAACYRVSLAWALPRAERFVLRVETDVYDSTAELAALEALGAVTAPATSGGESVVEGAPSDELARAMTEIPVPAQAISGDLCPVRVLELLERSRRVYAVIDYGRDQVYELTDQERDDLLVALGPVGISPGHLVPAPTLAQE